MVNLETNSRCPMVLRPTEPYAPRGQSFTLLLAGTARVVFQAALWRNAATVTYDRARSSGDYPRYVLLIGGGRDRAPHLTPFRT